MESLNSMIQQLQEHFKEFQQFDQAEEIIRELKNRSFEITQSEKK